MNQLFLSFLTSTENNSGGGTMDKIKGIFKHPAFYIVIGALVLLIIVIYLLRRIVKPKANATIIIVRHGNIQKVINEGDKTYFLVPFADRVGAIISHNEKEFSSDKLFINNGPDALYKVNYTLKYKVIDPKEFYKYSENIQNLVVNKLNDDLREFADKGNALVLVKDYREHAQEILNLINKAVEGYSIEAKSFKINLIEPLGRK